MRINILIIHGAGLRSYRMLKEKWIPYLEKSLGKDYPLIAPEMPNPQFPQYAQWKETINKNISQISGPLILIGHSLGAAILLKYVTEEKIKNQILALYLVATPYFSEEQGWNFQDFFIKKDPSQLLNQYPIYSYHSTDDRIVPVTHQGYLSSKLPHAVVRTLSGHGHEYNQKEFKEIIEDIRSLGGQQLQPQL